MHQLIFEETQYSSSNFILGALVIAGFMAAIIFLRRLKYSGFRWALILTVLIGIFILSIVSTLRLKTRYYTDGMAFQFVSIFSAPFEQVSLDTVVKVAVITYNPDDYGGWGLKGNGNTKVYSTDGNKGIMFTFKNGRHLLLGTMMPDSLRAHLKAHYPF
ncbi:MAG: hypothetical protein ACTHJ0_07375 [Flavipsychrobacter sp.]